MRLKSLQIKGFKSFADKTVVSFDEGITGIIGPNGCGKSNIIDSIRWVIGEQKISALRSENLEALVFNGSKTRSASGLAEVSLTFENTKNLLPTEFSTVTVTRKFFKNGDSEYRLNDVQCRMKDIHNLFMDTGISTDSYAIIELGMVDDIIKDKENSRRRMLEQAAGITIYKTRKKEAKNKLDATEQDLARIEDLLFEINNQLKSLENQAKKAEKYYEFKKEYKELAIELAKAALQGFHLNFQQLNDQQELETNNKIQIEAEVATGEAQVEKEKLALIDKERVLQSKTTEFNALVQHLSHAENDKKLSQQSLQFLKEKESSIVQFLSKADSQVKNTEDSINLTNIQIAEEENKLKAIQNEVEAVKVNADAKKLVTDEKRKAVDVSRNEYYQIQRKQFDAEKTVAVADTSIQNLQRSNNQLTEEKNNRIVQLAGLEQELVQKETDLNTKKASLIELQEHQQKTKDQILSSQAELEALRNKMGEEGRKLDAKKNEYALLKSLIDSMEGYPDSVKFLHKNPNWNHAAPILSDIIYVQKEYRAAIENVLEPYLNYYVVNDLNEGLQAIKLLDTNNKGKANFFLLDKLTEVATNIPQPENTIKALDVIEVDAAYKNIAEYLLNNVFIAENDQVIHQSSSNAVILDKSGKYVKGKYTLTGGSVGLFEGNKIGRSKNLEKLNDEVIILDAVVKSLKAEIQNKHDEVINYNQQLKENLIKQTENEISQLTNQLFACKNKIENIQQSQQSALSRLQDIENRLQNEQNAIAGSKELLVQLNEQFAASANNLKTIEEDYKQTEQEYNQFYAQFNEQTLSLTRQQSKLATLKQEFNFKSNQLTDLHNQIIQNKAQQEEVAKNIIEKDLELQKLEKTVIELLHSKENEEKTVNQLDAEFHVFRNAVQEKETELRSKQKTKDLAEQSLAVIKDKLNDLKLQLASIKERLQIEFKVEIEEVLKDERTSETPVEDLQVACDRLKKRIENLGEVNPTAIEAYTEMKKRYEFIIEQKNDLVDAKDSLLQTIQEVEAKANQQFLDTFNAVRENFQKVFKALFTEEDTADMVLVNPENLAETGIDIVAKPKGKRPSSITQLSGGEKTLTATALLFAIYLIKPAPFCILDEVDAPLDDANVEKFTNMIKKFSENSQFIIVTHNKKTMSSVDVIYGVTMQEPGVSKLVPVDFRSLN